MLKFFMENTLIPPKQKRCIKQLSITRETYKSLNDGYEVRGVFLDISKAFDKVWHSGLLYKFRLNGIHTTTEISYIFFKR